MLKPVLITPPAEDPVTLAEVKAQMKVDDAFEDTLIDGYIKAAVAQLDGYSGILGRCLVDQVWRVSVSDFGRGRLMRLPFPDVSAVVVKYYDADNAEQVLPATNYEILQDATSSFVRFNSGFSAPALYDRADAVAFEITAGFGAAANVPAPIKVAVQILAARFNRDREGAEDLGSEKSDPVAALIAPFRRRNL